MKFSRSPFVLIACYLAMVILVLSFVGCTSGNATVAADNASVAAATSKLATDQAVATSQPTTQNVATVSNDQLALTSAISQLSADVVAIKTAQITQGTQLAQAVAAFAPVPTPYSDIAKWLIGAAGAAAVTYIGKGGAVAIGKQLADSIPIAALPSGLQAAAKVAVSTVDALATHAPATAAV